MGQRYLKVWFYSVRKNISTVFIVFARTAIYPNFIIRSLKQTAKDRTQFMIGALFFAVTFM